MIGFQNNKSPDNDGFIQEFYQMFWRDFKDTFLNSLQESKLSKYLCTMQQQAIIKLISKPNNGKRYFSDWGPIFLLNFDQKILSKALAVKF